MPKTTVFIGSSSAAKSQARAVIEAFAGPTLGFLPWGDAFALGRTLLEGLDFIAGSRCRADALHAGYRLDRPRQGGPGAEPQRPVRVRLLLGRFGRARRDAKSASSTCPPISTATSTSSAAAVPARGGRADGRADGARVRPLGPGGLGNGRATGATRDFIRSKEAPGCPAGPWPTPPPTRLISAVVSNPIGRFVDRMSLIAAALPPAEFHLEHLKPGRAGVSWPRAWRTARCSGRPHGAALRRRPAGLPRPGPGRPRATCRLPDGPARGAGACGAGRTEDRGVARRDVLDHRVLRAWPGARATSTAPWTVRSPGSSPHKPARGPFDRILRGFVSVLLLVGGLLSGIALQGDQGNCD